MWFAYVGCSDAGTSETQVEDYCSFVVDNLVNQQYSNRLSDVAAGDARRYMCEIELTSSPTPTPTPTPSPTPICQAGWTRYVTDGSELSDSCLQSTSTFSSWTAASVGCPAGSHMLSIRASSLPSTGLHRFVETDVHTTGEGYAGASQSSLATVRNRGWAWVDGTDASNLNCGTANQLGCGVWSLHNGGEPKYAASLLLM